MLTFRDRLNSYGVISEMVSLVNRAAKDGKVQVKYADHVVFMLRDTNRFAAQTIEKSITTKLLERAIVYELFCLDANHKSLVGSVKNVDLSNVSLLNHRGAIDPRMLSGFGGQPMVILQNIMALVTIYYAHVTKHTSEIQSILAMAAEHTKETETVATIRTLQGYLDSFRIGCRSAKDNSVCLELKGNIAATKKSGAKPH